MLTVLVACSLARQLPPPAPKPLIGLRNLALSPDGARVAFSYRGDVWVAPSSGGRALQLTNHVEMDDYPVWSPDGQWIVFSSNRSGNLDLYVAPADGGETKRLTWQSGRKIPTDWSPDGKTVVYAGSRENNINGVYGVDVATGRTSQYFLDPMGLSYPRFAKSGILYGRFGFPWTRPRYHGSQGAQVWRYEPDGKRVKIRANGFQHLWPYPMPDGSTLAVTAEEVTPSTTTVGKVLPKNVDNVKRTPNLYQIWDGGKAKRLTNFVGEPVRFLAVSRDGSTAEFEEDGDIYAMKPGGEPHKVQFTASLDDKTTQEEHLVMSGGASSETLSPDGSSLVFELHNELWSIPTKKGRGPNADDATQLTDWAGVDANPVYAPDGKSVFFVSNRDGGMRLYRLDLATKAATAVTHTDDDVYELQLTPDKKSVSFSMRGLKGGLYTVPVAGGEPTQVISAPGRFEGDYAFSPDMRYVAYKDLLDRSGYYYWESASDILVLDTRTGKTADVTKLSAIHSQAAFSGDGKYLYFYSDRQGPGLYALPLQREEEPANDAELKYERPKEPAHIEFDFDEPEARIRKLAPTGVFDSITVDPATGDVLFVDGGDVTKVNFKGEELRKLTSGGGIVSINLGLDSNILTFVKNGALETLNLRQAPQYPTSTVTFRADWMHDLRAEHKAAFDEFWMDYNGQFYDPNMHARDWKGLKAKYERFLPSVGHRNEMATILNMLVGELESSHSEVSPAAGNPVGPASASLGVTFDYTYSGPGVKIATVPDKTPGSYPKTKLNVGDVIQRVNGKPVNLDEALYRDALNDQAGRDVTLTVAAQGAAPRQVKFRALSQGEFNGIVFNDLLRKRREYVEAKSGGALTYVHIAGMSEPELARFNQQVWEYAKGKKGLIIDVRNNGGGNTSDRIIDVLERAPNAIYAPRDMAPFYGPGQALAVPMVVMCAETSYSNAEMFPSSMRSRKLATLVGMQTPGYVIWTHGIQLVDGTNARMPGTGAWNLDGTPMEDSGVVPDFVVDISPEEYLAGRDPQLEKAVDVLVKKAK